MLDSQIFITSVSFSSYLVAIRPSVGFDSENILLPGASRPAQLLLELHLGRILALWTIATETQWLLCQYTIVKYSKPYFVSHTVAWEPYSNF